MTASPYLYSQSGTTGRRVTTKARLANAYARFPSIRGYAGSGPLSHRRSQTFLGGFTEMPIYRFKSSVKPGPAPGERLKGRCKKARRRKAALSGFQDTDLYQ